MNECPKFLSINLSENNHSILLPDSLRIPLSLHGSISYIPSHHPTKIECDNLLNVELTLEYPTWDPHYSYFSSHESKMVNHDGSIISIPPAKRAVYSLMQTMQEDMNSTPPLEGSQTSIVLNDISPALDTIILFLKVCHTLPVAQL